MSRAERVAFTVVCIVALAVTYMDVFVWRVNG
jgi:hypothetical protein